MSKNKLYKILKPLAKKEIPTLNYQNRADRQIKISVISGMRRKELARNIRKPRTIISTRFYNIDSHFHEPLGNFRLWKGSKLNRKYDTASSETFLYIHGIWASKWSCKNFQEITMVYYWLIVYLLSKFVCNKCRLKSVGQIPGRKLMSSPSIHINFWNRVSKRETHPSLMFGCCKKFSETNKNVFRHPSKKA